MSRNLGWLRVGLLGCVVATGFGIPASAQATILTATANDQPAFTEFNDDTGVIGTFTTDTPSDSFSATVNWGDGNSTTVVPFEVGNNTGNYEVIADHEYTDDGPFTISFHVLESGSSTDIKDSNNATATVLEGDFTLTAAGPITIAEGGAFSGAVATFTDGSGSDLASDYTASVDWGDGATSTATIVGPDSGGVYTVLAGHTYVEEGSYTPTVTVHEPAALFVTSKTDSVTVTDADSYTPTPATIDATAGTALSGAAVATFTDSNTSTTATDLSATIDWGDGTTSSGTVSGSAGSFTVTGSHTYASAGQYPVVVTFGESGGTTALAVSTAHVVDEPVPSTQGATDVGTGGATLHGTVVPNGDDTTYYFNYGTSAPAYGSKIPLTPADAGSGYSGVARVGPARRADARDDLPLPARGREQRGDHDGRRRDVHDNRPPHGPDQRPGLGGGVFGRPDGRRQLQLPGGRRRPGDLDLPGSELESQPRPDRHLRPRALHADRDRGLERRAGQQRLGQLHRRRRAHGPDWLTRVRGHLRRRSRRGHGLLMHGGKQRAGRALVRRQQRGHGRHRAPRHLDHGSPYLQSHRAEPGRPGRHQVDQLQGGRRAHDHRRRPVAGATYSRGQTVHASYSCHEGAGGPGLTACAGPVASGAAVNTSTTGRHTFKIAAVSHDGQITAKSISYRVVAGPSAQIAAPVGGRVYALGQHVATTFSCADGAGGPGISSCRDSNGARGGRGHLDTSRAGHHVYRVTAVSRDGRAAVRTIAYRVAGAPRIRVTSPRAGDTYLAGRKVLATYGCHDGASGPGITSCTGPVANGSRIDTTTAGAHTFTVVAKSRDGQTATTTVTYTVVVPQNNLLANPRLRRARRGHYLAIIRVPASGTVHVLVTKSDQFVFASGYATAPHRGTVRVALSLTRRGQRLARHHHTLVLRVWVTFAPFGGVAKTTRDFGVHLRT